MKRIAAFLFVVLSGVCAVATAQTQPQVPTNYDAWNLTLAQPTSGPVIEVAAGATLCSIHLNSPSANTTITPQGSNDGYGWYPLPTINRGTITSSGVYVGVTGYKYFRPFFNSFSGTISGYEACADNATSLIAPMINGGQITAEGITYLPGVGVAGCAGIDAGGHVYSNGEGVCVAAGGGSPGPTSSPGGAPLVVPANASAVPYSGTNPFPVTTPPPGPTPIPYTSASPLPVTFATPLTVNQGTSPWVVTTAAPLSTLSVTQGTSPWVVNTPVPAPTAATYLFPVSVLACPSTAPAAVNSTYVATCDSSGNQNVNVVNVPTVKITPTASPPPSGYAQGFGQPVISQTLCNEGSTATLVVAAGNGVPVGCAIVSGTNVGLPIMAAACGIGTTTALPAAICPAASASLADSASNTVTSLPRTVYNLAFNGTSWDRSRKDTYAAGPMWVTDGGGTTTAIAAATAGPTVIKGTAGRLARVLVSANGTTGTVTIYDNASACSGTIIGIIPGTTAVVTAVTGSFYQFEMPAANGITACGGTGSAAVTISWY